MYPINLKQIAFVKVSLEQCDLEEAGGFMDHLCLNEEDLEPFNCKRSKYETKVSQGGHHRVGKRREW
jgi:hypothetical protein